MFLDKDCFNEIGVQNNMSSSVKTVGLLFSGKSCKFLISDVQDFIAITITNNQSYWVVEEIMKMTVQSNALIKKAKEGQKRQGELIYIVLRICK